MFLVNCCQ